MTEKLVSNGEQTPETQKQTNWDILKDASMGDNRAENPENSREASDNTDNPEAHKDNPNNPENLNPFETELTSPADVLADVKKFALKDGKVYSKETGEQETDEDTILRVKTSKFLFNEAKEAHDRRVQKSRSNPDYMDNKPPSSYVDEQMRLYGFIKTAEDIEREKKDPRNKPVRDRILGELVENGSHNGAIGTDHIVSMSEYAMFVGEKGELGKAMLERRLKQHGLEMTGFQMDLDTFDWQKKGFSDIKIKVDTAPITKFDDPPKSPEPQKAQPENHEATAKNSETALHHPAAEQLSKLEAEIANAKKNGDEEAARYYRAAMKMAVERNRLEVSPEDWAKMDDAQKGRFYRLKRKEEKILGDDDAAKFWEANLRKLKGHAQE